MSSEWRDYQQHVLHELKRLNDNIEKVMDKSTSNEKEIAVIRVRSGFWGSIAGGFTVIIALVIEWFLKK